MPKQTHNSAKPQPQNAQAPTAKKQKKASYQPGLFRRYRWLISLLVMIPVIYIAVQMFIILLPRMSYSRAIMDTMSDTMPLDGFVVLQSVPVYATPESAGGVLYYSVPTGQRVSANAPVVEVYSTTDAAEARASLEHIDEEIKALETAQRTVETGDRNTYLAQMQKGIYNLLDVMDSHSYGEMQAPRAEVTLAANKLQIVSQEVESFALRLDWLIAQKAKNELIAVPQALITAPETGYFLATTGFDHVPQNYDALKEMSPSAIQKALLIEPKLYGSDVIGHVVGDYKWHFFAVVPQKDAHKFIPGDKSLRITFPNVSDTAMPVRVQSVDIDEVSGLAKIELLCERITPAVLQLNNEKVEIIFRTEKGVRIDKDALHINNDGAKGVYVRFGNSAIFKRINILMEDQEYMLVSRIYEKGVNEVELYDEVIVDSGEVELYDGRFL